MSAESPVGPTVPAFMSACGSAAYIDEPEILIELARYRSSYPYHPRYEADGTLIDPESDKNASLYHLVTASFFRHVRSVAEWKQLMKSYPKSPLAQEEAERPFNPEPAVRAHWLRSAAAALMKLNGAPDAPLADIETLLSAKKPRAANGRAKAQAEILNEPKASIREIARLATYDGGAICADRDAGLLLWPA